MGGFKIPVFGWLIVAVVVLGGFVISVKNNKIITRNSQQDRATFRELQNKHDAQMEAFMKSVDSEIEKEQSK